MSLPDLWACCTVDVAQLFSNVPLKIESRNNMSPVCERLHILSVNVPQKKKDRYCDLHSFSLIMQFNLNTLQKSRGACGRGVCLRSFKAHILY